MKFPKVIVFDVGGTLIKNIDFDFNRGFQYLKLVFNSDDSFIDRCNTFKKDIIDKRDNTEKEISFKDLIDYLSKYYQIKQNNNFLFIEENFRKSLYKSSMIPNADTILKYLSDKGIKLYCFSNSMFSSEEIKLELDQYDLSKYFISITSSADYGYRKPSKKVFSQYLDKETDIWFIGNEIKYDIMPVLDLGGRPIMYSNKTWVHPEFTEIKSYLDLIKLFEE